MRILVVEDERKVAAFLRKGLEEEAYAVDVAPDGESALQASVQTEYDLIVLDLLLPGIDGLEVCGRLRSQGLRTPILMLTAKDSIDDKVRGLDSGADDYLTKPFEFSELLARIRALLRRSRIPGDALLRAGDLTLDPARRVVTRAGRKIKLTVKEYALLEYMLRHPNRTLTRTHLLAHVWEGDSQVYTNVIDVYVSRLRQKLAENPGKPIIVTEHGLGYRLEVEGSGE